MAGLAGPQLLGDMVQSVTDGTTTEHIDKLALILAAALLAQTVLTWLARRSAFVLAENVFAVLRERFLEKVLSLPLSTVERAGTGDLVTRSTGDIEALARTVRFAVPEVLVASVTVLLTVVAGFLTSPLMALPLLCGAPVIWAGTKWYLRRAPEGYLAERECYAAFNGSLAETVDGARTVEALGLGDRRIRRLEEDLEDAFAAERYTLRLRTVFFPAMELAYAIPISLCLIWGGWLVSQGSANLGQVTAVTLYAVQLVDPVDRLVSWLDEVQVGATALARILGVELVPPDREQGERVPDDEHVEVAGRAVRLPRGPRRAARRRPGPAPRRAARRGRAVRRRQVDAGPAAGRGAPAADRPGDRRRRAAGRAAAGRPAQARRAGHPGAPRVRRHRRPEPPAGPAGGRRGRPARPRSRPWTPSPGCSRCPTGLATEVGSGGRPITPAQAQQLALARLVLADPHTLVLDEATSLLDPRAARHLERSLAAVLHGRTVVAIAHRLHTAHDADRVAVVEDGLISELGSHDELIAARGAYAALWDSWRTDQSTDLPRAEETVGGGR